MSIFRTRGFDSIIGKGMIVRGELLLAPNSTFVIEGLAECSKISVHPAPEKVDIRTELRVPGTLQVLGTADDKLDIKIHNVVITGTVNCNEIWVEGTLALKTGAVLKASKIYYRKLIIETGSVVHGEMFHLDHASIGELT